MRPPPRPGWIAWGTLLLTVIGTMVLAVHVNAQSDRKWCSVVDTLNEAYEGGTVPATPAGVKLRDGFVELRRELGCPAVR